MMCTSCRQLPVVLSLLAWTASFAPAETVLNFPRLSFGPGRIVGVAVFNPNSEDATLAFTAFRASGDRLDPTASVIVPAGRQFATLVCQSGPPYDNSLFGEGCGEINDEDGGWFQGVSESDHLTGFFLFLNDPSQGPIAQLDGSDLPEADSAVVFNQITVDGQSSTELTIVNPNPESVVTRLTLSGRGDVREETVPPGGTLVVEDVAAFFEVGEVDQAAFVRAETDGADIFGFELVQTAGGDPLALNAQRAAAALNTLYFPQFAVAEGIETQLGLINYSDESHAVVITAHAADGTPFGDPVTRTLAGSESVRESVAELFELDVASVHQCWLQVTATSEAVNGYLSYSLTQPGGTATALVSPVAQGNQRAVFSHIATDRGFFTGLAALNPGALAANVTIAAFDPSGESLGSQTRVLLPGQRISRLVDELVPDAANQAGGFILVDSDVPIYLTSLFGAEELTALANIPPQNRPPEPVDQPALGRPRVRPIVSVLRPGQARVFQAEELTGTIAWRPWDRFGLPNRASSWTVLKRNSGSGSPILREEAGIRAATDSPSPSKTTTRTSSARAEVRWPTPASSSTASSLSLTPGAMSPRRKRLTTCMIPTTTIFRSTREVGTTKMIRWAWPTTSRTCRTAKCTTRGSSTSRER